MRTRTIAAVFAALALPLAACGTSLNGADAKPTATVTADSEEAADAETADEANPPEGDSAVTLDDTVTYEDDTEVSLSGFARGVSNSYAAPGNTPYLKFTVEILNGGDATLDLNEMSVTCQYGDEGHEAEEIFDDGLDGTPTTHLRPGRSINAPIACELPKDETYAQIEIALTYDSETAIFAGDVK